MEKARIKNLDTTTHARIYINVRAHVCVCVCARRRVNLCTHCPHPPRFSFALPDLTFTMLKLTFTPLNLRFKVPQVHLLSGPPGQAYTCANGEKVPWRTNHHADRDKGQSNVSAYGKRTRDRDWDNRAGQVQYAHRYGFQKSSYLIFMCYVSSNVAINHDIIKYTHVNNRQKPTLIHPYTPKGTNAPAPCITFASLSSTS